MDREQETIKTPSMLTGRDITDVLTSMEQDEQAARAAELRQRAWMEGRSGLAPDDEEEGGGWTWHSLFKWTGISSLVALGVGTLLLLVLRYRDVKKLYTGEVVDPAGAEVGIAPNEFLEQTAKTARRVKRV